MDSTNTDSAISAGSWLTGTLGALLINNAPGIIIGLLGLAIQLVFQVRRDLREQRALELQEKENDEPEAG